MYSIFVREATGKSQGDFYGNDVTAEVLQGLVISWAHWTTEPRLQKLPDPLCVSFFFFTVI